MVCLLAGRDGRQIWKQKIRGAGDQIPYSVDTTSNLGAWTAGSFTNALKLGPLAALTAAGGTDAWLARLSSPVSTGARQGEAEGASFNPITPHLEVYPNPARGLATLRAQGMSGLLSVEVFSLDGRLVAKLQTSAEDLAAGIQLPALGNAGTYQIRCLDAAGQASTIRLVVE